MRGARAERCAVGALGVLLWAAFSGGCDQVSAASAPPAPEPVVVPERDSQADAGQPRVPVPQPAPAPAYEEGFFGFADTPIRERMTHLPIARIEKGTGGRSLGFKLTLKDGTQGYYKPEQTFSAANWYAEIAAYHLDRELGLGKVPAVVSRAFPWAPLRRAARGDKRIKEIIVQEDGKVRGAFVWWIPGGLRALRQPNGWEEWIRVRPWPTTTITPFQRPRVWEAKLRRRRELGDAWISKRKRHLRRLRNPRPDRGARPQELSDMVVFDYLTRNIDRWGGGNANVLVRGTHGPLVFLDNGAGFANGLSRPSLLEARLQTVQRFRRSTVEALRAFDMQECAARLEAEALAPILSEWRLARLADRRSGVLEWVARMEERYGERVYAWESGGDKGDK